MISPHGGILKNCLLPIDERAAAIKSCDGSDAVFMTSKEISDLLMISNGSFSPLTGFMARDDYYGVLKNMRLSDGTLWPLPVTLAVSNEEAENLTIGKSAALIGADDGITYGKILISDIYHYDKQIESLSSFGTDDLEHPGVSKLMNQKANYIGGKIEVYTEGIYAQKYSEYASPAQVREIFNNNGWQTITAFQTRNPIHRSHEYLTKIALEVSDGIFIHPVVGALKQGDIPAEVRMDCYQALIDNYYPKDRVVLKVYPMEMRYAGPKEAVLHAIIRQNFGCTHIIIGRDHAGVGKYYGPFDAQNIFDQFSLEDLQIQPLKIDWTFWCEKCKGIASTKTCPHDSKDHVMISGTELRKILTGGQMPPEEIIRPEVAEILIRYYKQINE